MPNLPREIWLTIFGFIKTKSDLARTKKVCKLFKNIIETNKFEDKAEDYSEGKMHEKLREQLAVSIYELLKKYYSSTRMPSDWNYYTQQVESGQQSPLKGLFFNRYKTQLFSEKYPLLKNKVQEYLDLINHEDYKQYHKQIQDEKIKLMQLDLMRI